MNSPTKPTLCEPTPEQVAEALDLLREANRLDQIANDAMLKAEAAFRAIGKPLPPRLPLFPDDEGR